MGVAPNEPSGETLCIRIDQQLVRIEAKAAFRFIRAVHPVAVDMARHDVVEIAVPDVLGPLGERNPFKLAPALAVEQTKLDFLRICGKQREIGSAPVPTGSERV